jgi:hypothetical protein
MSVPSSSTTSNVFILHSMRFSTIHRHGYSKASRATRLAGTEFETTLKNPGNAVSIAALTPQRQTHSEVTKNSLHKVSISHLTSVKWRAYPQLYRYHTELHWKNESANRCTPHLTQNSMSTRNIPKGTNGQAGFAVANCIVEGRTDCKELRKMR